MKKTTIAAIAALTMTIGANAQKFGQVDVQAIMQSLPEVTKANGELQAQAQQYDNETFQPVKARTFELPGLTAWESTAIVIFLMGIENPSAEVVEAIDCAMAWFEKAKIRGIKVARVEVKPEEIYNAEYPYDNVVVEDASAPAIWARYYELTDNRPFMAKRSGEKVWRLADVNPERRTGYDWYGYWPEEAFQAYADWKQRMGRK